MEKIKYSCPKCGEEISRKKEDVSDGYFGACLKCNEDFYKFELRSNAKTTGRKKNGVIRVTHYGEDYATLTVEKEDFEISINLADAIKKVLKHRTRDTKDAIQEEIDEAIGYISQNNFTLAEMKDAIYDDDFENALINYGFYLGARKALGLIK